MGQDRLSTPQRIQPETPSRIEHADATPDNTGEENWWDYCPNCAARLHNRGCKYRCPRCHYFMSCSDFDQ